MPLTDMDRLRLLEPPGGRVPVVLDTDTYNEIDDQFAVAYAVLATDRLDLRAIYAAPFHNSRSSGPGDGMRRSYDEILRVVERCRPAGGQPVLPGSDAWLPSATEPVDSPAARDLVDRARATAGPLYVLAIGAATNVASALLMAPDIAEALVVVWLGGNPRYWHKAVEFNVEQDMAAARVLFDSGVALVHVPCLNVTEQLRTTLAEIDRYVRPAGPLGGYLAEIYEAYLDDHYGRSKSLWDLGAVAWVLNPAWAPSHLLHSPVLTDAGTWSDDPRRHLIREVRAVDRDAVFGDLFRRLAAHATASH